MPRLIYADALHHELVVEMVKCVRASEETKMTMAERVLNKLDEAPTIDPESLRPNGRWTAEHTCTHCGEYALTANLEDSEGEESQLYYHTPSCPWCGAKMDLEGT